MSSYSKKKSCDFVVTAENTGKVLALSQRFLPDALYCFTLKHFSNLLKKEDCTVGANVSKKSKKRQVGKHYRPNIKKQKPRRLKLRPLEPHERDMAEEHHGLVLKFLAVNRLPMEDYYDVVIFRYLLAVEKWFCRPELYRYGFASIAWAAMSSALSHEREKQRRRPQTVSLEEPIPGCDGLTWGDTITQRNLPYTPYLSEAAL